MNLGRRCWEGQGWQRSEQERAHWACSRCGKRLAPFLACQVVPLCDPAKKTLLILLPFWIFHIPNNFISPLVKVMICFPPGSRWGGTPAGHLGRRASVEGGRRQHWGQETPIAFCGARERYHPAKSCSSHLPVCLFDPAREQYEMQNTRICGQLYANSVIKYPCYKLL